MAYTITFFQSKNACIDEFSYQHCQVLPLYSKRADYVMHGLVIETAYWGFRPHSHPDQIQMGF